MNSNDTDDKEIKSYLINKENNSLISSYNNTSSNINEINYNEFMSNNNQDYIRLIERKDNFFFKN